ncbi:UDP-N-acetylglucosamine 2-epimerase [Steroidobacter denitrificans]|uniref:UDP-N-acetylglucosamine 2-epimerase n=1 Tax=Steroidobacter denitrificans TaxID=465721 RepID=A0A127FBH2_STEDE|nr:UDP-N-acetylglucosamine 2-epimerase (non-hydrolyzing) [Steroidobacter denitrificans]AMN46950.1 UDP-N-acetylglucosamine 2-epimerase [Steroidobacter denitrificans]
MNCRVHLIAAARPNFMKIAPLYHVLAEQPWIDARIVHTGQHYDRNMSENFFLDLRLPDPHFHLEVGSGTHAEQTAKVMVAYEKICSRRSRPDWTIVVGDVNSTIACALAATKLWIPVIHLEAGLRSSDRRMPEEINRLVTDAISDVLWTPSPDADENLLREGVAPERIDRVGNIMIDSYEMMRPQIEAAPGPRKFGLRRGEYAVVTLHRPSNVDQRETLVSLVTQLHSTSAYLPLLFAVHPRTRKKLVEFGLWASLESNPSLRLTEPLGYVEFMALVSAARLVITDSGGVQEESTYLGIPCLTLRENTERPITVMQGTNRLVPSHLLTANVQGVLRGEWAKGMCPQSWDGRTALRCLAALKRRHEAMVATH